MKVRKLILGFMMLAGVGVAYSAMQVGDVVLVDLGKAPATGTPYWNQTNTIPNSLTLNTKGNASSGSTLTYSNLGVGVGNVVPKSVTVSSADWNLMQQAVSSWNSTYGATLDKGRLEDGLVASSVLSAARNDQYTIGGLTAGAKYSLSMFVNTSSLVAVTSVNFTGNQTGSLTTKYTNASGALITLGSGLTSLNLLQTGQQMITWEFTAGSTGSVNVNFNTPLGLGTTTAVQAMAFAMIPESSSALLSVLGVAGFALRRHRKV